MADILETQDANPFRISAYRRAADTVAGYDTDIGLVLEREGSDGLIAIPSIGRGIASAIREILTTGSWPQLERLRGAQNPARLFQVVPGIGEVLAQRIHDTLHIDTLEALEAAACDGRLAQVEGIGERRLAAIAPALAQILRRRRQREHPPSDVVPISQLLELDARYRREVSAGTLPLIAPKRFNPEAQAWLPILHTSGGEWHFTVMFSNTALAHKLGRNYDWVVIYYYDADHREGQYTLLTETRGDLLGKRVVRGREAECRDHYTRGGTPLAETYRSD